MLSSTVAGAIEQIDDALDVLAGVDLTALSADDLIRLAGRCETLARRLRGWFGPENFRIELQRPYWRHDRARNRWLD